MSQQKELFETSSPAEELWRGMPEFRQDDLMPWKTIKVHFRDRDDMAKFGKSIGQKITDDTRSVWFPETELGRYAGKRYASSNPRNPQYPVYIISKGRWKTRLTAKALDRISVPYFIVVEPQEYENYAAVIDRSKILTLPFSNLGQGSIPARNWVWDRSVQNGDAKHWILDDNIQTFIRFNRNLKVPVADGTIFYVAERCTDRYENVAISGFNYKMFAPRRNPDTPPVYLNTRVYSCILIRNDIPYRWRGKYNEDTDLCLRALKDGWCTILFNAFLARKETTMTMKGGNTDELYKGDGRLKMAESLREQHSDIVKVTTKWGRPQHHVDYSVFKRNKLRLRPGIDPLADTDNFGMELRMLEDMQEDRGELFAHLTQSPTNQV